VSFSLPIDGSNWNSVFVPQDKPSTPPRSAAGGDDSIIGVPASMRCTPLTRTFTSDRGRILSVAIINETTSSRSGPASPSANALKQGWRRAGDRREIVGVVADVKFEASPNTTMQVYLPFAQDPPGDFSVLVRTAVEPGSMRNAVEGVVGSLSRDMPVSAVRTMEALMDASIARQRMALIVLTVFALVALVLASTGLYGLVAHSVTERTHEIGVRMALGAERGDVVRLVIRHGLTMTLMGIVLGVAGAAALSKSLEGLVFGVQPMDPLTFASVVLMLLTTATLACYLPAWRATRIAPTTALRNE
jgi:putative ABC transport system permease protein